VHPLPREKSEPIQPLLSYKRTPGRVKQFPEVIQSARGFERFVFGIALDAGQRTFYLAK